MLAAPTPSEAPTQPRVEASHQIDFDGRHAIIRDVELFGEVENGGDLGEITLEKLRRIADFTNGFIRDGRYPLIVIRHAKADDGSADHSSWGRIENVRVREGEKTYIVGDLRVAAFDLDHLISRYPRRSAEIAMLDGDADGRLWMKNVALIGRETPGAALPDVALYSSAGTAVELPSDTPEITFTSKGTGTMSKFDDAKKAVDALDPEDRKKLMAKYAGEDDKGEGKPDAKPDDKDKQADNAAATPESQYMADPKVVMLEARVGDLLERVVRQDCEAKLRGLEQKGYQFDFDAELDAVASFTDEAAREAHFKRIEDNYKRRQTAHTLVGASQQTAAIAGAATEGEEQTFTADDAQRVSTHAARLRESDPNLDPMMAMAKAAKALGLDGKVKKYGLASGN